jgi:hypothetical protein
VRLQLGPFSSHVAEQVSAATAGRRRYNMRPPVQLQSDIQAVSRHLIVLFACPSQRHGHYQAHSLCWQSTLRPYHSPSCLQTRGTSTHVELSDAAPDPAGQQASMPTCSTKGPVLGCFQFLSTPRVRSDRLYVTSILSKPLPVHISNATALRSRTFSPVYLTSMAPPHINLASL